MFFRLALLLALLALAGCGTVTVYKPAPADTAGLTPKQARELLIKANRTMTFGCQVMPSRVTYESYGNSCRGRHRYADHPELVAMSYRADPVEGRGRDKTCINPRVSRIKRGSGEGRWHGKDCLFYSGYANGPAARDFVRAWAVLAREGAAYQRELDAAFERAAEAYRAQADKPRLPEDAVRFKVQAEAAVKQSRFDDAAELYTQALDIAPWWPAGHYNRALIRSELKEYEGAISDLKRYLAVVPEAENARAAQLKIYEWEGLAKVQ